MVALVAAALLATPQTGFAFGRTGGNIRPFRVAISTDGAVHASGAAPRHERTLTKLELATLNRVAYETRFAMLPAHRECVRALPDAATLFIRVGGHTVRVHGTCVSRFNRLWTTLAKSIRPD
jgi:hypothetical protein